MSEQHPIETSIGNDNRHTMWCQDLEQMRHYCVCLWLKDSYEAGRISADDPHCDCAQAMNRGSCIAQKMRTEEVKAEHAIYFVPKEQVVVHTAETIDDKSESFKRGWNQVGSVLGKEDSNYELETKTTAFVAPKYKKVKKAKTDDIGITEMNMADVVSKAVKDEVNKTISKVDLVNMKKKVMALIKTDKSEAKKLFDRVKMIEKEYTITT